MISNTAKWGKESGVSCFEARRQPDGSLVVLTHYGRLKQLRRLVVALAMDDRLLYEVRGDVVGQGKAGEPLLRNCEAEELPLSTPLMLDPPEDRFFAYMMAWSRWRQLRAIEGLPNIVRGEPTEDGAFTHGLLLHRKNAKGWHARQAALLFACLRRASPGTRLCLDLPGGRCFDLGETSAIAADTVRGLPIQGGEKVLALTAGPDAEQLMWAAAEVFTFRPDDHTGDWLRISALVGGQQEARWSM
jgi:hypothetical protein